MNRERWRILLLRMPRPQKRAVLTAGDIVAALLLFGLSFFAVAGALPSATLALMALAAIAIVGVPMAYAIGFYRSVVRFVGVDLLAVASRTALVFTALAGLAVLFVDGAAIAARTALVYFFMMMVWLPGSRFVARLFMNRRGRFTEPVIIYGAGQAGVRLAAALTGASRFFPVAFVDDNPAVINSRIDGLEVHPPRDINVIADRHSAKRVLIAIPSASRRARRRIIDRLEPLALRVQTIPDVGDIIAGSARVDDIRDVAVEDLLGRDPVPPSVDLLEQENRGRVVMVTGAGGSIGSELVRQLALVEPERLVLVERSEIALYRIDKEIRSLAQERGLNVEVEALLGCAQDRRRMFEIMNAYGVDAVYHAAAYKHVPIVEHNAFEGIRNNVFGTRETALAAVDAGVSIFVLVSTDKAVSPTNVMGASKRLAEITLQALQDRGTGTRFCMVRFGNVLASSGSVVPLFREQIRRGGPVTVTHPEITRYFMTIPEAAQLVIQAGALARGGDVFVLDMGEPVRIVDLARKMIRLMGLKVLDEHEPDGDIEVVFTGLRPAEKLYEELIIGSDVTGTRHPRVMRASEQYPDEQTLADNMERLERAVDERDYEGLRSLLLETVEGYRSTGKVEDRIAQLQAHRLSKNKIADLSTYR